jgi:hypothetical protein
LAHPGTAGASFVSMRAGTSGETSVRATSAGLMTILSMLELPKYQPKAEGEYSIVGD